MNDLTYSELGWIIVLGIFCLAICCIAIAVALDKLNELYDRTRRDTQYNAVKMYAISMEKQIHWFHGRDAAVIKAVLEDMKNGNLYADAGYIRDQYLPRMLKNG